MKVTAGDLEAAFRQKRRATSQAPSPTKRARQGGPSEAVAAAGAARAPPPAEAPAEERPVEKRVPEPAGTEVKEGEISVTTEAAVVILDLEEGTPATVAVSGAGQVTIAAVPSAAVKLEARKAPPAAGEKGPTEKGPNAGADATGKKRDGPEGSSRRLGHHSIRRRVEGPQDGPARPGPRLQTMIDAGQAAVLLRRLQTEESAKETQGLSFGALIDSMMVAVIQIGNYSIGLRDAVAHSSDALTKAMARSDRFRKESEAHRQSLARLHEESRARKGQLNGLLREAESRASAVEAKLELASEKLKATGAKIGELTRQLQRTREEVQEGARSAAERVVAAEKAAAKASLEKAGAVACADEARARAGEAEARAREAEAKAVEAEARAREAEAKVQKAEEEAETAARRAVEEYKASEEFKQEVVEGSLDAYAQGFQICKEKISAALKIDISELEGIGPGGDEDEPENNEGKPGPDEP